MGLDFIIQVECTKIDLNWLFPKKYCWYTVKKHTPRWGHSFLIEVSFSNGSFGGHVFLSQEMANILAQKQLRYIILTVSTCVPKPLCWGEMTWCWWVVLWLSLECISRARPRGRGCFRIGKWCSASCCLVSLEGRVGLLREVKQNMLRASDLLQASQLSFAGKGNLQFLGSKPFTHMSLFCFWWGSS